MTSEVLSPTAATATMTAWPVLSIPERRVLGVLVEKAKTTPDTYPLSLNALVAGCNQKTNRDPVLNLSETEIEGALAGLQQKGLAIKITGGRVVRWRHNLYESWHLGKVELAIIGELLLRGPQTEGELRGRASRMEEIDDLDTLRNLLRPMAERRLVVYLSPEARRGTMLTHGFHPPRELEQLRTTQKSESFGPEGEDAEGGPRTPAEEREDLSSTVRPALHRPDAEGNDSLSQAFSEIADLRKQVAALHAQLEELTSQVRKLQG